MKNKLTFFAGFLFGIAGWTVEFFPNQQFLVRTIIVLTALAILSFIINFKMLKKDTKIIYYFLIYLNAITISVFFNEDSIPIIIRETLLIVLIFYIISLINNFSKFKIFFIGLITSSSSLIIYYFLNIDFNNFFVSYYRLSTGLGATGIGVIGLMLSVIYFDILVQNKNISRYLFLILITLFIMSFIVILATKSRTSMILLLLYIILYLYFLKQKKILLFIILISIVVAAINYEKVEVLLRIAPIEGYGGDKSITNLTGRTDIWNEGINLWQSSPLIGVGPSNASVIADGHIAQLHNAYLQVLVSTGVIGFIPLIILMLKAFMNLLKSNFSIFKVIFIIGLLGGLVESRLFNFGSPGNFIFLLSFVFLLQSNFLQKKGFWHENNN